MFERDRWAGGSGGDAIADALESAAPGAALVSTLVGLEPADAEDATLLEAIAGWERVTAWAAARQAAVVAELHRRRERQRCHAYVLDEIAARLACTRHAAEVRVGLALGLERLPAVADALAAGTIDVRKATVITEDLLHVPEPAARTAATAVLADAETLTAPQVRARLRRLEIDRDPDGAAERHRRARTERHVELTPTTDAMAWLAAYLPADEAVGIYTAVTAIADAAPPDDPRPIGARRADALVDLATRWLDAGVCPDGPLPVRQGRRPHLNLTASASTLLGLDEAPSELAGYGPVPAPMARRIAARSTWTPLLVDARTGEPLARSTARYQPTAGLRGSVVDRDITCVFPGCRLAAERCDLDHVAPFVPPDGPRRVAAATDGDRDPENENENETDGMGGRDHQTSAANLHALCRHHHRAKTHAAWSVQRDDDGITRWRSPTGHMYDRPPATSAPPHFLLPPPPGIRMDLAAPPPRPRRARRNRGAPPF